MELDESQVRAAAQHLGTLGWARLATGPGSRTAKYRQLFGEALDLLPSEVSILGVLMLRGPQTVAELKTRTERLYHFGSNEDVTQTLTRLDEKELVHLLPKQPGQREERLDALLADAPTEEPPRAGRRLGACCTNLGRTTAHAGRAAARRAGTAARRALVYSISRVMTARRSGPASERRARARRVRPQRVTGTSVPPPLLVSSLSPAPR